MTYGNYQFRITLSGYGNTAEEAWRDAIEGFTMDPGACPTESECEFEPQEEE